MKKEIYAFVHYKCQNIVPSQNHRISIKLDHQHSPTSYPALMHSPRCVAKNDKKSLFASQFIRNLLFFWRMGSKGHCFLTNADHSSSHFGCVYVIFTRKQKIKNKKN